MVILSASGVCKTYGVQTVLQDVSFNVNQGDKIGILGVNGAGKTTLLRMICGEEQPDAGELYLSRNTKVAYMRQHAAYTSERTALEEVLEVFDYLMAMEQALAEAQARMEQESTPARIERFHALQEQFLAEGGMTYAARARSALLGLGLSEEELNLPMSAISGGQRTRVLLARLLLGEAKLLLLDEPTNHLDISAIAWLEDFLQNYRGTVLVISHDRFFLDRVTNRTFDVHAGRLTAYNGGYTEYLHQKTELQTARQKAYAQKRKEIERLEGIIAQQKQWNREKNLVTARSKQKAIDRIEATLEVPDAEPEEIRFSFKAEHGAGNDVLIMDDVSLSFEDGAPLFSHANMHVRRGEHVFLLGDNGTGKTTLFRLITGQLAPDSGEIELGSRVKIGYFDQAQSDLPMQDTVLQTLTDALPHINQGEIRKALAAFLFHGEDVHKRIEALSGGERARVALARLMLSRCNFLLMDEPTNHLDIPSKEALEEALLGYDGTLLLVSHDRYFIDKLADKIYCIANGALRLYPGDYQYYLAHAENTVRREKPAEKKPNDYQKKKEEASKKRRLQGELKRLEEKIAACEREIAALQEQMAQPEVAADYERVCALSETCAQQERALEALYATWGEYAE